MSIQATYQYDAATLSSAAVLDRIVGPENMIGEVTGVSVLCTTGLTGTEGTLNIGNSGNASAFRTLTLPNTSANERVAGVLSYPTGGKGAPSIAKNEVVEVSAGGEPTAGAGNIFITIEWS